MSDAIDYENTTQPGTPPLTSLQAQKVAEDMIASGISAETVNAHLKSIGVEPLDVSPSVQSSRELAQLKADPEWVAKLNRGDPDANAKFNSLTFAISTGSTKVERAPVADDYVTSFKPHPVTTAMLGQVEGDKAVEAFVREHAEWSAALALSPQAASAINEMLLDGTARFTSMSEDEKVNYAQQQTVTLLGILARDGDPDARIKAAQTVLKNRGGRDIDINRICRQVGAEMALELVLQAERLARR
jgi:hypothetical protein